MCQAHESSHGKMVLPQQVHCADKGIAPLHNRAAITCGIQVEGSAQLGDVQLASVQLGHPLQHLLTFLIATAACQKLRRFVQELAGKNEEHECRDGAHLTKGLPRTGFWLQKRPGWVVSADAAAASRVVQLRIHQQNHRSADQLPQRHEADHQGAQAASPSARGHLWHQRVRSRKANTAAGAHKEAQAQHQEGPLRARRGKAEKCNQRIRQQDRSSPSKAVPYLA
mmetsp:Transcript_91289/g.217721  ORF Transcript_91289/g.217721 Transcript_91289/m.217721 type:complete len:225 (-) Transcript_91289:333-1007(-)